MIGYLKGMIQDIVETSVIVDVQGVGYEVHVAASSLNTLEMSQDKDVTLWIYTHVREDSLELFGFLTKEEKKFFISLLKVNGIGPKKAIDILSGSGVNDIIKMIDSGNVKSLSQLPKVGKKTAEQMILTLKGKLVMAEKSVSEGVHAEVAFALVNLGFKHQQVELFVSTLSRDIEVEEGVRKGLQALSASL